MKSWKRLLTGLLCAALLLCSSGVEVRAADDGIMPCYDQIDQITLTLSFASGKANCYFCLIGDADVTYIGGTLTLYDITAQKSVTTWPVSANSSVYSCTKTYPVTSGHRYRLSYDGIVKSPSGVEYPKHSTTATN